MKKILDYLRSLGITTIYSSPIFEAAEKSLHGYDVTDPHVINPEIGTEEDLMDIANKLTAKGMNWLQDIVPNHMAFDSRNFRLMDVLERGQSSEFANYFDINWEHQDAELRGRLMVPFLGQDLKECLDQKEIKLHFDESGFVIRYNDHAWPVSTSVYKLLLRGISDAAPEMDKESAAQLVRQLSGLHEKASSGISKKEWQAIKEDWLENILNHPTSLKAIRKNVEWINNETGLLKEILDDQYYVPAFWRNSEKKINYRRFFTVNGLICLRMEEQEVFDEYHQYIRLLLQKGYFSGLRIDHIDGLYEPGTYTQRLRELAGKGSYLIAEKILARGEDIPEDWPIQGTSGYEFLSQVSRLFTDVEGAQQLVSFYKEKITARDYEDIVFQKKLFFLHTHMEGDLQNLINYLLESGLYPRKDGELSKLSEALAVFMAAFPVYRLYPESFPINKIEYAEAAFQKALQKKPALKNELEWIRSLFEPTHNSLEQDLPVLLFLKRLLQFTGPLAAKGVEDTVFYFYNPLISHNEVGDAPGELAISSKTFHREMLNRKKKTPFSLNATSTHDTKRGEDARARINVLSEIPGEWINSVQEWTNINLELKQSLNGKLAPSFNEEYFIYQSMVGSFPATLEAGSDDVSRLKEYVQKSLREEKLYTDWAEPDESYENACFAFIDGLFNARHKFIASFTPFVEKVIQFASVYSLAQVLLKITCPGIPDIYQGTELWDLSYVDPDNRRLVDYEYRISVLQDLIAMERDPDKLLCQIAKNRTEGWEKMYVMYKCLQYKKNYPELFWHGEYIPLEVKGGNNDVLAYARSWQDDLVIVIVPVKLSDKTKNGKGLPQAESYTQHKLVLPAKVSSKLLNEFTSQIYTSAREITISEIFSKFPVALLRPA